MKFSFRRFFLALFVSLTGTGILAGAALATGTTANVSWIAPTQYADGETLTASQIDHYTITWTTNSSTGVGGPTGSLTVPGTATTAKIPVPCGGVNFSITVTTGANAVFPNTTSVPAGPVPYATGVTCAPNPPTGLAVS